MSHTTSIGDTNFIHNGSYDGDIEIQRIASDGITVRAVVVPFEDLKGIVAFYVRDMMIRKLEQAGPAELLSLIEPS